LTNSSREGFRVDNPGSTVPGDGVESGPKVEEEHAGDSSGRKVSSRDGRDVGSSEVTSNDIHRDGTTDRSDEKNSTTSKVINDEEAPNEGENSLDDTEDTSSEETSASSSDTDRTEESRRVVVDGVDTSTVLPHEERSSDEHSTEEESFSEDLTERCPESRSDGGTVVLDLNVDLVDLVDEIGFLRGKVSNEAKVLDGLISTVSGDQPTRGLLDEEGNTSKEHSSGDELNSERNEPLLAG